MLEGRITESQSSGLAGKNSRGTMSVGQDVVVMFSEESISCWRVGRMMVWVMVYDDACGMMWYTSMASLYDRIVIWLLSSFEAELLLQESLTGEREREGCRDRAFLTAFIYTQKMPKELFKSKKKRISRNKKRIHQRRRHRSRSRKRNASYQPSSSRPSA